MYSHFRFPQPMQAQHHRLKLQRLTSFVVQLLLINMNPSRCGHLSCMHVHLMKHLNKASKLIVNCISSHVWIQECPENDDYIRDGTV